MTIINKDGEQILEISTPDIEVKYGVNTPQLRTGVEVLGGGSGGGNYYSEVTQGNYTTPTVININCGFEPKYIKLTANENGNPGAVSHTIYNTSTGITKGFNLSWYGSPANQTNADFSSSQSCLLLDEYNSSNDVRGRIENVGANGFDINLYEVEYSAYVTIIVECFG